MPLPKQTLSAETIQRLAEIFEKHRWEINSQGSFNRFCEMLTMLSEDQQDCVLQLTQQFLKVDLDVYRAYIKNSVLLMPSQFLDNYSKIYIMPLNKIEAKTEESKPIEQRKVIGHSSDVIAYAFNDSDIRDLPNLINRSIYVIFNLESLPANFNAGNSLLLLVDDFIGSGETVETCFSYLRRVVQLNIDKVHVLALVGQSDGLSRLVSQNIHVYCSVSRNKGISDNFQTPVREQFTLLMEEIENLLQVSENYKFGYNRSEALVKMIRTPNNTFPFYWLKNITKTGQKSTPPFPR